MDASEIELRDAYRSAASRPPGPCPDAGTLAAFAGAGESPIDEALRGNVVDHVARCTNCADEVKALLELREVIDAAVHAPAPIDIADDDPAPLRWLTAWARWRSNPARAVPLMILVLACVLGVSFVVWRSSQLAAIPDDRDRSASAWTIDTVPSDRAVLASAPARLEWSSSTTTAEIYRVMLYDAESTVIWESPGVTTPFVDIPVDVRQKLLVGGSVFWRVVAVSGIDRRESSLHRFTIRPAAAPAT